MWSGKEGRMTRSDLRVAVFGGGRWGRNLIRNFHDLDVLAAVADPNPGVRDQIDADIPACDRSPTRADLGRPEHRRRGDRHTRPHPRVAGDRVRSLQVRMSSWRSRSPLSVADAERVVEERGTMLESSWSATSFSISRPSCS